MTIVSCLDESKVSLPLMSSTADHDHFDDVQFKHAREMIFMIHFLVLLTAMGWPFGPTKQMNKKRKRKIMKMWRALPILAGFAEIAV